MPNEQPSDSDLLRDLEAFKALHQPKTDEPQKPASEETAVKMHAVQLAMQELSKLERERIALLASRTGNHEAAQRKLTALLGTYKRLLNPDLLKQTHACPQSKFYTHTISQYRWFDENASNIRITSPSEHCHYGRCITQRDTAYLELFTAQTEAWEAIQQLSQQLQQLTTTPDSSMKIMLDDINGRIQTYRAIIQQSTGITLPEIPAVEAPQITPVQQLYVCERPTLKKPEPRTAKEIQACKQIVLNAFSDPEKLWNELIDDRPNGTYVRGTKKDYQYDMMSTWLSSEHVVDIDIWKLIADSDYFVRELGHAPKSVLSNPKFIFVVAEKAPLFMNHCELTLLKDRELWKKCLSVYPASYRDARGFMHGFSSFFRDNEDMVMLAAEMGDKFALQNASPRLQNDRCFVIRLLKLKKSRISLWNSPFRNDPEILALGPFN